VGERAPLPATLDGLMAKAASVPLEDILAHVEQALVPSTTSLLHSSSLKPAAVDIESRFIEAALGNVHGTDLRNFGHGRHHWFAKRPDETGIIALVGDHQNSLATRTLALIPESVPTARIDFGGPKDEQALAGLVVSLHIAAEAGRLRGIDPAKPGMPPLYPICVRVDHGAFGPSPVRNRIEDSGGKDYTLATTRGHDCPGGHGPSDCRVRCPW
jgi:hypothetical protein